MRIQEVFSSEAIERINAAANDAVKKAGMSDYNDAKQNIISVIEDCLGSALKSNENFESVDANKKNKDIYEMATEKNRKLVDEIGTYYVALASMKNEIFNMINDFSPDKTTENGFFGYFSRTLSFRLKDQKAAEPKPGKINVQKSSETKKIIKRIIDYCNMYGVLVSEMTAEMLEKIADEMGYSYKKVYEVWKEYNKSFTASMDTPLGNKIASHSQSDYSSAHDPINYVGFFNKVDLFCIHEFKTNKNTKKFFKHFFTKDYIEDPCINEIKKTVSSANYKENNLSRRTNDSNPSYISSASIIENYWDMLQIEYEREILCEKNHFSCIEKYAFDYVIDNRKPYENKNIADYFNCTPANISYAAKNYNTVKSNLKIALKK